jgi:hypothetical protein
MVTAAGFEGTECPRLTRPPPYAGRPETTMDPVSIATSLVMNSAAAQADLVAIKLMRQNAQAAASVVELIDSANQNMSRIQASLGPGMGANLDVTV